jgi:Uma2 family endonuclease
MAATTKTMSAEELWRLPSDNMRHELINGELRTMPPAGFEHGAIVIRLSRLLANHVEAHKLGIVVGAETGFLLRRSPDLVRGADIAFVVQSKVSIPLPKTFWPGAPDLAVEVLSPSDTVEEIEEKISDYLVAGSRLVWVVNPKRKTVAAHRPSANPVILAATELLQGGDVVPGFECAIHQIFI